MVGRVVRREGSGGGWYRGRIVGREGREGRKEVGRGVVGRVEGKVSGGGW